MEILNIKDLSFTYPNAESPALSEIDLNIEKGSFNLLCGESGCGKTTLLKLIKREIAPFGERKGSIVLCGEDILLRSDRASACDVGYVAQNTDDAIVTDTVWRELSFGLENMGCSNSVIKRRVGEMASFFGLEKIFSRKINELSGGQKQMVSLASVMLMQPKLLILDEPTSKLDPIAASDFIASVKKINNELGVTIIIAEHRLEELIPLADSIIYMEDGRIPFACPPREFGQRLSCEAKGDIMQGALPSAARLFARLGLEGESPLTVNEGRRFLSEYCNGSIKRLEDEEYIHSNVECVKLEDLYFRYDKKSPDVISGAELTVYDSERFFILGGNGSGKTTLLSLISAQRQAYRGRILINGKRLSEYKGNSLYRGLLAVLPQNPRTLFLKSTVEEDMLSLLENIGASKEERKERIRSVCERMDIDHLLKRHPFDLSGGETQKCALAKVLLTEPRIILLDEPTKGYDPRSKATFAEILKKLKDDGITTITVSHDIEFAAGNADRCAMLFGGEVISADTPRNFFSQNYFYTTEANRISRDIAENAITVDDLEYICRYSGDKR